MCLKNITAKRDLRCRQDGGNYFLFSSIYYYQIFGSDHRVRIPFFHYTHFDNLPGIVECSRLSSREYLDKKDHKFTDVSIDPSQSIRNILGLLNYIPLFPGFYTKFRGPDFNKYLFENYDNPKVQNKSFYGTLNKTLRKNMDNDYEKIIILLVKDDHVYNFAENGKIRFFTDIAIKPDSKELRISNNECLLQCLANGISDENISGEIDLLDDGRVSIGCPCDVEAIIVDNEEVAGEIESVFLKHGCQKEKIPLIFVSELPRNPV